MFYLLMPDLETRQAFIMYMKERGIASVFHYLPLHRSEFAQRIADREYHCPMTESISDRLVRLPLYNDMADVDLQYVVEAASAFSAVVHA
jgi:dTDP-4-amino-4,6-dideoxygalactose transaminase